MSDDLICPISQKAFIEKNGEILLLHDPQIGLDLPGGKIMSGEDDLVKSLQREVLEETSLAIRVGHPFYTWFFTIPTNTGHILAGKKIFIVGYRCSYLSGELKLSDEHDWYKWINKNNYKQHVKTDFQRIFTEYFNSD